MTLTKREPIMTQKLPPVPKQKTKTRASKSILLRSLTIYRRIILPLLPISTLSTVIIALPMLIGQYYLDPLDLGGKGKHINLHQVTPHMMLAFLTLVTGALVLSFMFLCIDALIRQPSKLSIPFLKKQLKTVLKKSLTLLLATVLYSIAVIIGTLLYLPGIFLAIIFILYTPIILFDHYKALAALKYSWKLVWGNWWRTFAFLLLFVIINMCLTNVLKLVIHAHHFLGDWFARILANAVLTPWVYTVILLCYQTYKKKLTQKTEASQ